MADEQRPALQPGGSVQITLAALLAVCGLVLGAGGVRQGDGVLIVCGALQLAAGLYLLLWHLRVRGGPRS
ncbi:hypothetical protein [Cellulomonas triticagri]|uniref:Uncharacterized protein n=1 Tax=Cellulomonas triticagri TaxID=2483352 RepID=A0A3M2JRU3_9CELL|nr:hypothetical protein [Cellulomonas triticagri]RMI12918.1 hypothetical protein EBM89_06585 [Cellulomonas triticagri]